MNTKVKPLSLIYFFFSVQCRLTNHYSLIGWQVDRFNSEQFLYDRFSVRIYIPYQHSFIEPYPLVLRLGQRHGRKLTLTHYPKLIFLSLAQTSEELTSLQLLQECLSELYIKSLTRTTWKVISALHNLLIDLVEVVLMLWLRCNITSSKHWTIILTLQSDFFQWTSQRRLTTLSTTCR